MKDILIVAKSNMNSAIQGNEYMSVEEMDDYLIKEVFSETTTNQDEQPLIHYHCKYVFYVM